MTTTDTPTIESVTADAYRQFPDIDERRTYPDGSMWLIKTNGDAMQIEWAAGPHVLWTFHRPSLGDSIVGGDGGMVEDLAAAIARWAIQ